MFAVSLPLRRAYSRFQFSARLPARAAKSREWQTAAAARRPPRGQFISGGADSRRRRHRREQKNRRVKWPIEHWTPSHTPLAACKQRHGWRLFQKLQERAQLLYIEREKGKKRTGNYFPQRGGAHYSSFGPVFVLDHAWVLFESVQTHFLVEIKKSSVEISQRK